MRIVGKILLGIISIIFFVIFILLATVKFEVLNKAFLFGAFEKHNVYVQLPSLVADSLQNTSNLSDEQKIGYGNFINNIPPKLIKPLVENNLGQIVDYLNGQSKDVTLSFSLNGIGFENASGLRWSLSQMPDKNLRDGLLSLNEAGNTIIILGAIILTILIAVVILYGKGILLVDGIFIIVISLIGKLFSMAIGDALLKSPELQQKLLGLLLSSLLPDITTSWLVIGGVLIVTWFILYFAPTKHEKLLE